MAPTATFSSFEAQSAMNASVHRLADHKAFTCECGSVNFALLMSDGIECNGCGKRQPFEWKELNAHECPQCGGEGRRATEDQVDNSGHTLPGWTDCETCDGLGVCGPDAKTLHGIRQANLASMKA